MSKNNYYDDVKVIKKPLKKRLKHFLNFLCIASVFAGVIAVSFYLSDALVVGNLTNALVYGDTKVVRNAHSVYAVILGEYDSMNEAETVAMGSSIQGASGYVWQGEKYYVIGSIYFALSDAEAVIKNLEGSNYSLDIMTIEFDKININFGDLENKEVGDIETSLDFIDELSQTIYNQSISYDKGESNNFAISSEISSLRGQAKVHISNLQKMQKDKFIDEIQDSMILIDELLDEAILKTIENSTTNYSLKNTLARLVRIKYDLYNNLK